MESVREKNERMRAEWDAVPKQRRQRLHRRGIFRRCPARHSAWGDDFWTNCEETQIGILTDPW